MYGDISSLSGLTNLERIDFCGNNTQITGDISNFSTCTSLTTINVWGSKIYGDISVFGNMPNFSGLIVSQTQVLGDISSLANNPSIVWIDAQHLPNLSGSINSLSKLTGLMALQINNT